MKKSKSSRMSSMSSMSRSVMSQDEDEETEGNEEEEEEEGQQEGEDEEVDNSGEEEEGDDEVKTIFSSESPEAEMPDIYMNEEMRGQVSMTSTRRTTSELAGSLTSPFLNRAVSTPTNISSQTTGASFSAKNNNMAALIVALPTAIFALLLFATLFLIWKKILKRKPLKRDSEKSDNKGIMIEVGEVNDKSKNALSVKPSVVLSMNNYTDLDSYTKGRKGAVVNKNNAVEEAHYAEVDENPLPQEDNSSQPVNNKVGPKESHEYEEAVAQVTQSNDEYEEAKFEGTQGNQWYEEGNNKGKHDDQGYETSKATDPVYHTLDPDAPSDSSYASVSVKKQDGGYDTLNRLQNPNQTNSQSVKSDYDLIERIGKGNVIFEPSNQIGGEYSAIGSRSANSSAYDKLDRARRSHEADNINPNEYNTLQPQSS